MRGDLRTSLEGLAEDCFRRLGRLQEMQRELHQVTATASHRDGLVTVVVGPRGQVQDIRFDPRVYRKLTPSELSRTIMELIDEATADVADQMEKIMTPFMPEGVTYEKVLGEKGDVTSLLPQTQPAPEETPEVGQNNQKKSQ